MAFLNSHAFMGNFGGLISERRCCLSQLPGPGNSSAKQLHCPSQQGGSPIALRLFVPLFGPRGAQAEEGAKQETRTVSALERNGQGDNSVVLSPARNVCAPNIELEQRFITCTYLFGCLDVAFFVPADTQPKLARSMISNHDVFCLLKEKKERISRGTQRSLDPPPLPHPFSWCGALSF